MKKFLLIVAVIFGCVAAFAAPPAGWLTDYDAALKKAKTENKCVYVLFTGSDWCGWCMKLRKDVLTKPEFRDFASKKLVMVYCDFPRKTKLSKEQLKKQRQLGSQLGAGRGVPSAVVVDGDGKVLGRIGGYAPLPKYLKKLETIVQ